MNISCRNIAKKFKQELLFSNVNYDFEFPQTYALLGPNSSGKSTLLKIIAGILEPSNGEMVYQGSNQEDSHTQLAFSSPEMSLLPDYCVEDIIKFHFSFKKCKVSESDFLSVTGLQPFVNKAYTSLSSGLKNKLKLSLALFSDVPVLLLDEPCTNFDDANLAWYQKMINSYCNKQLIIIASNQETEYHFCTHKLDLKTYKS